MTIKTNLGEIEAELDLAKAPCTAASFEFLAEKKYFDNTTVPPADHDGQAAAVRRPEVRPGPGGPSYQFADENLPEATTLAGSPSPAQRASPSGSARRRPAAPPTYYPKGTIAMANAGPDTNGSQFFIVYNDGSTLGPRYSIVGPGHEGPRDRRERGQGRCRRRHWRRPRRASRRPRSIIQTLCRSASAGAADANAVRRTASPTA